MLFQNKTFELFFKSLNLLLVDPAVIAVELIRFALVAPLLVRSVLALRPSVTSP